MDSLSRRKIIVAFALFIALVIGLVLFALLRDKSSITLYISPLSASAEINGKTYNSISSEQKIPVKTGTVTLRVYRDGFSTYETTFDIAEGNKDLFVALTAESDEAKTLLATEVEAMNQQYVATQAGLQAAEQIRAKYPFLNNLPYYGRLFTVSQGVSQKENPAPEDFAIYIDYIGGDERKEDALQYLRNQDVDPADFEIIYRAEEYKSRYEDGSEG